MEAIKLPMKHGRMEDIGDEEVCYKDCCVHVYLICIIVIVYRETV